MAKKDAGKENVKVKKPKQGPPQDSVKPKKPKKEAAPVEAPVVEEKKPEAPRPPADPRLKYVKKFHGRFLPRGPLRDRHTALFARWNSGEDHGGVTFEELKSLYEDWRATRQKPVKKTAAV